MMVTAEQIQQAIESSQSALVRDVLCGLAEDVVHLKSKVARLELENRELNDEISGISGEMERILSGPQNVVTGVCERLPERWVPSVAEVLIHPLDERAESRKSGW